MDTPEKALIRTPISNVEESPFSNFINTLSPIKTSKTLHISQTLGTLSFTSPPSVFTSPQINPQKESRFLRRHQLAELGKPGLSSDSANKDILHKKAGNPADLPSSSANVAKGVETSVDAPCEASSLAVEPPREFNYNHGSPGFQTAPSSVRETKNEPDASCVSFGTRLSSLGADKNEDLSGCEWDTLISDCTDLVVFESPQDPGPVEESQEQSVEKHLHLFASLFSPFPEDDVNDLVQQQDINPSSSDVLPHVQDQGPQPAQANQLKQIYLGQDNNCSSSLNGSFAGQSSGRLESKPNLQRGMRRRCLVFEIPGSRKNGDGGIASTSSSTKNGENTLSNGKQQAIRQGGGSLMCVRPGIGLHLNALAVASKDHRVPYPEALSSETQLIPVPRSPDSSALITSAELGVVENEGEVAEDASQASEYGAAEDSNLMSPKKKRRRPENAEEGEACKRCNCKKSKCLKLYCECFAAGVYCSEPCTCQDCFNKPIHEDTVLATRKQIESRNPLAFAPKVIRGSDSANDLGDEPNRTPASARHKRGCNCKKSNCLKKYCECYQGGVGCSIGCRCESCKNTFGRKDGSTTVEMELEVEEDALVDENSLAQSGIHNDEDDLNPGSSLSKTPLGLFRSSMPVPSSSKGKPPRLSGKSTFLRSQNKPDKRHHQSSAAIGVLQNTSPGSIKTLSPNSKRISPPNHESLRQSPGLRSSRKLILQSIPSFPSLTPRR